jgi:hypothetical protein
MTFPTCGIVDDFNRANGPIGALWSAWMQTGAAMPNISSSQVTGVATSYNSIFWNSAAFGPNCEAYITVATKPSNGTDYPEMYARLKDFTSTTTDGYAVYGGLGGATQTWIMARYDNGAATQLGSTFVQNIAAGDSIGIEVTGSTINAMYKPTGGSWTTVASRGDTTYSGSGCIGFYVSTDTVIRLDNFGGGTIVTGSTPASGSILLQYFMHYNRMRSAV